jgi:hypothetical protein
MSFAQKHTIIVTVPDTVIVCYAAGDFDVWNPYPMTKISDSPKKFSLDFYAVDTAAKKYNYKFLSGPDWKYQQNKSANFVFATDSITAVVDTFMAIFDPVKVGDISITITSYPEGTSEIWIIGSFCNWSLDGAIKATYFSDEGWFSATIPLVEDIEYKCYNYRDLPYEEAVDAEGNPVPNRTASFETGPVNISVAFWKKVYGTPTGINDPISAAYKMYTTNGTIVVEGVNSNVAIFDLDGNVIQNVRVKGTFVSNNLPSGLYIIRVDNKAQKIVVR